MSAQYILNPITNRNIKVGSRTYQNLIGLGVIQPQNAVIESSSEEFEEEEFEEEEFEEDFIIESEEEEFEEEVESVKEIESESESVEEDKYEDLNEEDLEKIQEYVDNLRKNKNF